MEADGTSDDEILEFMNQDTEVDESKLIIPPVWMSIIYILGMVTGFVLLSMGIVDRI